MERAIATQTGLGELKSILNEIGENLSAHANRSLARTHGIELMPGYIDGDGNDLTTYKNSNGGVVGTKIIRFQVNGQLYYAPANLTVLAGNPSSTGLINTAGDQLFTGIGNSSWITDFTSEQFAQAQAINSLVTQHNQLSHNETHPPVPKMTALAIVTLDTAGHVVGHYIVQMTVGGVVYNIPCDTYFGGPLQPPRNVALSPSVLPTVVFQPGQSNNVSIPITAMANGTKPFTYRWQSLQGVYTDIAALDEAGYGLTNNGTGFNVTYTWLSTSDPKITLTKLNPGSGQKQTIFLRCLITNPAGTVTSPEISQVCKDQT